MSSDGEKRIQTRVTRERGLFVVRFAQSLTPGITCMQFQLSVKYTIRLQTMSLPVLIADRSTRSKVLSEWQRWGQQDLFCMRRCLSDLLHQYLLWSTSGSPFGLENLATYVDH